MNPLLYRLSKKQNVNFTVILLPYVMNATEMHDLFTYLKKET